MLPLIAIFDNDQTVSTAIASLGRDEGWSVCGTRYADASLDQIVELAPDLVVLDFDKLRMGGGWAFLQLLKMDERTASIPIVIMAVAFDLPREIIGYLGSRNIAVLAKPLDLDNFLVVARRLLAGQSHLMVESVQRLPILVVEDNLSLAESVLEILAMEGYLATTVPNGQLALDALQSGRHSLIILDINMPVMDGLEFLAVYAREPGPHTPVVIFSAYRPEQDAAPFPPFVIGRLPKDFRVSELLVFVARFAEAI
jgi:CheY-like chemotaxis protein